jgi:3-oxoacyl-[acyl-carrier-protein] synthase II
VRRVVVTGMAAISPIGKDWKTISKNLKSSNTGIKFMEEWNCYNEMITRLGAPVNDFVITIPFFHKFNSCIRGF